jgi:hypothetical protein
MIMLDSSRGIRCALYARMRLRRTVYDVDRRAARYGAGWFFGQSASGDIHALILSWALLAYSQVASLTPRCSSTPMFANVCVL